MGLPHVYTYSWTYQKSRRLRSLFLLFVGVLCIAGNCTNLKWTVSRDFELLFLCSKDSLSPYEQAKMLSRTFSQRYWITKFEIPSFAKLMTKKISAKNENFAKPFLPVSLGPRKRFFDTNRVENFVTLFLNVNYNLPIRCLWIRVLFPPLVPADWSASDWLRVCVCVCVYASSVPLPLSPPQPTTITTNHIRYKGSYTQQIWAKEFSWFVSIPLTTKIKINLEIRNTLK